MAEQTQAEFGGLLVEVAKRWRFCTVVAEREAGDDRYYATAVAHGRVFVAGFPRMPVGNWEIWIDTGKEDEPAKMATVFPGAIAPVVFCDKSGWW